MKSKSNFILLGYLDEITDKSINKGLFSLGCKNIKIKIWWYDGENYVIVYKNKPPTTRQIKNELFEEDEGE